MKLFRFFSRFAVVASLASALALLPALVHAQAAPSAPATDAFFHVPEFSNAQLSPDGRLLGMLLTPKHGTTMLAVMNLETRTTNVLVKAASDVATFRWVNDRRLVFNMTDRALAQGEVLGGPGIFAINADGTGFKELAERRRNPGEEVRRFQKDVLPYFTTLLPNMGRQDSDTIYVSQNTHFRDTGMSVALFKLDTVTGKAEAIKRVDAGDEAKTTGWMLDQNGQPRLAVISVKGQRQLHYLDPATQAWRELARFDPLSAEAIEPLMFGPDGTLYVRTRHGQDKLALHTFDVHTRRLNPKPVVAINDYDFAGSLIVRGEHLLGIRYLAEMPGTLWLDERLRQMQTRIDARLPATTNMLAFGRRSTTPFVLVFASSPQQPEQTYLYDADKDTLELLGEQRPAIVASQMGAVSMVRYRARDGLDIPAYLTLPKGRTRNLPLVVLVHGGPWQRGADGRWDADVQFLASRGYAVLEPQFRGSTGFGAAHFRAGFKQWGLAMQDDVADGAQWAIAQGIADSRRICIAGGSYGGYATLMGLIRDPALFRCGVNWVGVTDINFLYDVFWSDSDDVVKTYTLPVMIGDPDKDAAQLKATSPLQQAARLTQPLLLAYGGADRRVPIIHGKALRDGVSATNSQVQWIEYPDEGHGWKVVANKIDFWTRVARFLDAQIGEQGAAQGTPGLTATR